MATVPADLPAFTSSTKSRRYLWRAIRRLRPYWKLTGAAYVSLLFTTAIILVTPQFIRWIVDRGIRQNDLELLTWSVLGLLALTALRGLLTFFSNLWTETASQSVSYDLRKELHAKLTELSFAYHDRTESGQLLSRAMQDVERLRFATGRSLLGMANGGILLIGTTVALVLMNPTLALLAMLTMPIMAHRATVFGARYRPLSLEIQHQLAVLTTRLEQNLRGARIVKAFAQENAEIDRFESENQKWFGLAAATARLTALNIPLLDLIANLATVIIIWLGGFLVVRQALSLGELVAFITYLAQLAAPIRRVGFLIPALAMAGASAERVFEILDEETQVREAFDAAPLGPIQGHLKFENVSFSYARPHNVLREVSFEVEPGQVLALLGPTGSGKSSIINMIPRFYDPTEGRVLLDGLDTRKATLHSLRSQIGIVLQESTLFATTIRDNIAFGRPDATGEEVVEAAEAAQAHDFIMSFPDGYDTRVGERGATLSGGQRQRVAIARTLLTDPRILILDDATSSVDTQTEHLIQQALANLMKGRTSVIIAQRLSTVRLANQILMLEKGRIAAAGTHEQLFEASPLYRRIYEDQLQGAEL
ncbi:MAG: ABC transporter ATP-binding protein [Caldilineaceae bacterium SB0661_bin_32]|uniref:ABC transporter ATP-binding protein n=1 Tax=Caldilineaceae bacterium SB0661_bin_32 TaxID=2605255 RepID=A0A6B1D239_9CHLR|nr:ABC transporter ATP-binding protein [Caldilineaceae bacterium SB0661_bin_32]